MTETPAQPKIELTKSDYTILKSVDGRPLFSYRPFAATYQGKERSLGAAAAYQRRSSLVLPMGTYDFGSKPKDLIMADLMMPPEAPAALHNIEDICQLMQVNSRFEDGLLAWRFVGDLMGMSRTEDIEKIRAYVDDQFLTEGLCCDWAYHSPRLTGSEAGDHCHLLVPTREIGTKGLGRFRSDLNRKDIRAKWAAAWASSVLGL